MAGPSTCQGSRARWQAGTRAGAVLILVLAGFLPAQAEEPGAAIAASGTPAGAPPCTTCHGAHGEGNAEGGFPRLAGLSSQYLTEQLAALADGGRSSPIMSPVAQALSLPEREAVARYYASLPGPEHPSPAPDATGSGAALALNGNWADRIPACVACHGPDGVGVGASFPPLAGQPASYLQAQLEAWQQGKRPPGPLGLMQAVARRLSTAEIAAVSAWFGNLKEGAAR